VASRRGRFCCKHETSVEEQDRYPYHHKHGIKTPNLPLVNSCDHYTGQSIYAIPIIYLCITDGTGKSRLFELTVLSPKPVNHSRAIAV